MSDWKPGDLALCVDDAQCPIYPGTEGGIRKGGVYHVEIVRVVADFAGRECVGLGLDRCNPVHPASGKVGLHNAIRFRKIRPHTPDEQDAETIRLLTGAPVKEPSHV